MGNYRFNEGFLYKDSFDEKEFISSVLKYIKDDINAPSYIFDEMILGDVFRINVPIILSSGNSQIEYSRLIGIERLETTTKIKTKTYSNGFQNQTRSVSSRTITDWKRDTGVITGSATSGTFDEKYMVYDKYITNHIMDKNNIRKLTDEELNKYPLTEENVEYLKNDILKKVYLENTSNIPNKIKDEEYYGTTELYNTTCTIVSLYAVEVEIRDKKLLFIASSNGDVEIEVFGEYPDFDSGDIFEFNKNVTKERKEATKRQSSLMKYTLFITLPLFIITLILGLSLKVIALTIISFVILLIGIIVIIKLYLDIKKISKPYYDRIRQYTIATFNKKSKEKEEGYESFRRKF